MCGISRRCRDERGVGIVAALLLILILALLGTVMVALTVQEMDSGRRHVQSEQAVMVAEAGLQYARRQFEANNAWTGLAEPGRAAGLGHFIVVVNTTDADGTTVASPMKILHAIGVVGGARREVVVRATPGGGGATSLFARSKGDAMTVNAVRSFTSIPLIVDASGANQTYGYGEWQHQQIVDLDGWQGASVTGTISKVELYLYGYLSSSLGSDYTSAQIYLNNSTSGSAITLSPAILNTRIGVGSVSLGPWTIDITATRSWAASDFSGDLELLISNMKLSASDNSTLYLDAVALKVTTGTASTTFSTYREVIS